MAILLQHRGLQGLSPPVRPQQRAEQGGYLDRRGSCQQELTESVTLDTPLRFLHQRRQGDKFQYTTLEESSVDVTLQVYKMATLPVKVNFNARPRGLITQC